MENKTKQNITSIERVLNSEKLTKPQVKTLALFDRFNELEANCSLNTRRGYLETLRYLGEHISKPFEDMTKSDIQTFIVYANTRYAESTIALIKRVLKRFFKWLEWHNSDEDGSLKEVRLPKSVSWITIKYVDNNMPFEDLPTEEEVLKIASCFDSQRDRTAFLVLWESAASPSELLSLRVKDVHFNQYGAEIRFPRYTSRKTGKVNKLKTPYRHREIPIASSVPDLQLWLSMHPQRDIGEAPLFPSRLGGALSYHELARKFRNAVKKAGITKRLTLYSLRHARLTQVSDVLSAQQLKRFAGHSKYSTITARYIHTDGKAIQKKVYAERGIEVKEEPQKPPALKVKVCPRCKHKNSPTFKFCAMCSMPLDMETMFEVNERADGLFSGVKESPRFQLYGGDGLDVVVNAEWWKSMEAFEEWRKRHSNRLEELHRQMWHTITAEILQIENEAKAQPKP